MLSYQFAQGKRLSESQAMHSISLLSSILRYARDFGYDALEKRRYDQKIIQKNILAFKQAKQIEH